MGFFFLVVAFVAIVFTVYFVFGQRAAKLTFAAGVALPPILLFLLVFLPSFLASVLSAKPTAGPQQNTSSSQVAKSESAPTTKDTVQVQDIRIGDGREATPGSTVAVYYVAKLKDGSVFDPALLE
ncbi:hypothetical protein FJY94_07715 [Candidatus Kaiserbacteria bacterium]|nr:hypothetical protein [Candidatus Kaiserbacteria bacterium]